MIRSKAYGRTFANFSLTSIREIAIVLFSAIILANVILFVAGDSLSLVNKAEASNATFDSVALSTTFAVSNVEYQVSSSGSDNLKAVSFTTLSPDGAAPSGASVRLVQGSSSWFTCSPTPGGEEWYCPISGLSVEDINVFDTSITQ
jgi:hypothetical protein